MKVKFRNTNLRRYNLDNLKKNEYVSYIHTCDCIVSV